MCVCTYINTHPNKQAKTNIHTCKQDDARCILTVTKQMYKEVCSLPQEAFWETSCCHSDEDDDPSLTNMANHCENTFGFIWGFGVLHVKGFFVSAQASVIKSFVARRLMM